MYEELRKRLFRRLVCERSWTTVDLIKEIERIINKLENEALKNKLINDQFKDTE